MPAETHRAGLADGLQNRQGKLLLSLAIISGLAMMVPLVAAGPLALDEHGSWWIVDSDLPGSMLQRSLDYAAIPPLSSWLQWLSVLVLGKSDLTFRLPSAICAIVAIPVVYQTGKELSDSRTGGIAAMMLAWHPEAIDETRIARCYGTVLLLSAVLMLLTIRWLRNQNSGYLALLWWITASLLVWTHYLSGLLVAVCGTAVAISAMTTKNADRAIIGRVLVTGALTIGCSLPLAAPLLRLQEWGPFLNYSQASASIPERLGAFWWAGFPAGLLVCLLLRPRQLREWWARRRQLLLLLSCSLLPVLFLALLASGQISSLANPRYRVAFAPAAVCLFAVMVTTGDRLRTTVTATVVLLAAGWGLSPLRPWETGRLGQPADVDWRQVNAHLATATPETPILVQGGLAECHLVGLYAEDLRFMEYAACRVSRFYVETPHRRLALPFVWQGNGHILDFYRDRLREWAEQSQEFWVACATDTDLNRNSLVGIQSLARSAGFSVVESREWPHVVLERYAPAAQVSQADFSAGAAGQ